MFNQKKLKKEKNLRKIKKSVAHGKFLNFNGKELLNLGSNDYLGIATNLSLRNEFLEICKNNNFFFGSGASRLIYTSNDEFDKLESYFKKNFTSKKATIFNSGYCANLSCISAINDKNVLFIADKLVHASIIDAFKLCGANHKRYPHNNYKILNDIIEKNYKIYEKLVVVTESTFSMDGDNADIQALVLLKKSYPNLMLYVDEAHSFFVRYPLGLCKYLALDENIDFLLITLSKGAGGTGAVILSSLEFKETFVNLARSLIYSTAIPSINIAWTNFILNKDLNQNREILEKNIEFLNLNDSHICPFITYSNELAIKLSDICFEHNYFVPAIRPPTVPKNNSRLRISLRGDISTSELKKIKEILYEAKKDKF